MFKFIIVFSSPGLDKTRYRVKANSRHEAFVEGMNRLYKEKPEYITPNFYIQKEQEPIKEYRLNAILTRRYGEQNPN